MPNASLQLWYEELMSLDGVELPEGAEVYLCGNDGFVRAVRDQLLERGVTRVHSELFSPNDWLLD